MKNNVIINILPEKSLRQITNIPNAVAPNNTIDVTAYDNIIVFIWPESLNNFKNGLFPIANIIDNAVTMKPNNVPHIPNRDFIISIHTLLSIKYPLLINILEITPQINAGRRIVVPKIIPISIFYMLFPPLHINLV